MQAQTPGRLLINGHGSAGGGRYGKVRVNGSGDIYGDLDCSDLVVHGALSVHGGVRAGSVRINGTAHLQGDAAAQSGSVHGAFDAAGRLMGGEWTIHGAASAAGVGAERVGVRGELRLGQDCEVELIDVRGWLQVKGMLNADRVDLTLHYRESEVGSIGGSLIVVRGVRRLLRPRARLRTDTIEGDEVRIEDTVARAVRGNAVVIGRGCDVQEVEYRTSLQVERGARVGRQTKI